MAKLGVDGDGSEPGGSPISLARAMLRAAVQAVPAMRYAVGVGGIAALISIVLIGLKLDADTAVLGSLVVLALMIVLFVFSQLSRTKSNLRRLTTFMAWGFTALVFTATVLLALCFFFDLPKSIPCLLRYDCRANASPSLSSTAQAGPMLVEMRSEHYSTQNLTCFDRDSQRSDETVRSPATVIGARSNASLIYARCIEGPCAIDIIDQGIRILRYTGGEDQEWTGYQRILGVELHVARGSVQLQYCTLPPPPPASPN